MIYMTYLVFQLPKRSGKSWVFKQLPLSSSLIQMKYMHQMFASLSGVYCRLLACWGQVFLFSMSYWAFSWFGCNNYSQQTLPLFLAHVLIYQRQERRQTFLTFLAGGSLFDGRKDPQWMSDYSKPSLWYTFILNARIFKRSETSQSSLFVLLHLLVVSLKNVLIFLATSFNLVQFFFFQMTFLSLRYETEIFSQLQG